MRSAVLQHTHATAPERTVGSLTHRHVPISATISLSPRIVNILRGAGIATFEQLARTSDEELLGLENVGYAALLEIREALHNLGFTAPEPQPRKPYRTPLEQELWDLTAPAGGVVERGIALIHFEWNGRVSLEDIRDRYRVKRDLLRQIFLSVETQSPPDHCRAIVAVARFVREHTPMWTEDIEALLRTAGLARQHVTIAGILNACRIAAIEPGFAIVNTPRPLVLPPETLDACFAVVRSVQHLASIRGTATVDEVRNCAQTLAGSPIERKFARRAIALLNHIQWLDYRLGLVTVARGRTSRAQSPETREIRRANASRLLTV